MNQASQQFVAQKKARRDALLLEIYELSEGKKEYIHIDNNLYQSIQDKSPDDTWTKEEVASICSDFEENGLIEAIGNINPPELWSTGSYFWITASGIRELESMVDQQKTSVNVTVDNSISVGGDFQGNLAGQALDASNSVQNFNQACEPSVDEAVTQIQELLQQLTVKNPTATTTEKMKLAIQAVEQIEANPTWKQKAIHAARSGALEALKSNPVGAFVAGAIEDWMNSDG
ncbi:MAG: hypothetical protein F6J87_24250 [Spirulina sp. SIO3F2]|nr:hypothetical protein [Spirulina sp. SIO3F2]